MKKILQKVFRPKIDFKKDILFFTSILQFSSFCVNN